VNGNKSLMYILQLIDAIKTKIEHSKIRLDVYIIHRLYQNVQFIVGFDVLVLSGLENQMAEVDIIIFSVV
jgi:hypothetical protein